MPHLGFTKSLFLFGVAELVRGVWGLPKSILMPSPGEVKGLEVERTRSNCPAGGPPHPVLPVSMFLQAGVPFQSRHQALRHVRLPVILTRLQAGGDSLCYHLI